MSPLGCWDCLPLGLASVGTGRQPAGLLMLAGTQGSATEPTQQAGVGEASGRGARLPGWAFCIPVARLFAHSGRGGAAA